jgi:hypothetical protein
MFKNKLHFFAGAVIVSEIVALTAPSGASVV